MKNSWLLIMSIFAFVFVISNGQESDFDRCITCFCHAATNCNLTYGCSEGYCGPFRISKLYWIDSGREQLQGATVNEMTESEVYENCTNDYACAKKTTKNYVLKFIQDCNNDDKIDCNDYAMVSVNGWYICKPPLERSESGRAWLQRLHSCYDVKKQKNVDVPSNISWIAKGLIYST